MKTKLLIGILLLCVSQAFAQPGAWQQPHTEWSYDFTGPQSDPLPVFRAADLDGGGNPTPGIGITVTTTSITTNTQTQGSFADTSGGPMQKLSWIPRPTNAVAFLRMPGTQNSYQNILTDVVTNDKSLQISHSGGANKFSLYGIEAATPVAKFSFKIKFSATELTHTGGSLRLVLGNGVTGNAGVFGSSSNVSTSTTTSIFAGFQWSYSTSVSNPAGSLSFQYRKKSSGGVAVYTVIPDGVFEKNGEYEMEFYANNSGQDQIYTRGGTSYTLASKVTHIWANGVQIGGDVIANVSSTPELPLKANINAITFNHNGLAPIETADFAVSNINTSFVNDALPVTLTSFTAKKVNDAVNINWSTASETNNSYFEVLRSVDGKVFEVLGRVNGAGNSDDVHHYSFRDNTPAQGVNYYKLKQVDIDGKFSESNVVSVKTDFREDSFQIVKDGSSDLYALIQSQETTSGVIRVTDMSGKVLSQENIKLENGNTKIQLASISIPGVYVATLTTSAGKAYSVKFVK